MDTPRDNKRRNMPASNASRPSGLTKNQEKKMRQRRKAGRPVKTAEEYRAHQAMLLAIQERNATKRTRPVVKSNVAADCKPDYLREDVSDIYESVATPDAPIPAKSDTSHRTRAIWFNDLNKKYSFNGCFGQARVLFTTIRYLHNELKHSINQLERQFMAACLEYDLDDKERTWVREGFIDLWRNAPESALPMFYKRHFTAFRKQMSKSLPELRMHPVQSSSSEPMQGPPIFHLDQRGKEEDELDEAWANDDYNE